MALSRSEIDITVYLVLRHKYNDAVFPHSRDYCGTYCTPGTAEVQRKEQTLRLVRCRLCHPMLHIHVVALI